MNFMKQLHLDFLGKAFPGRHALPGKRIRIDHRLAWKHGIAVDVTFRPRARRYLLTLQTDGSARLVIPRRGTEIEGLRFMERSEGWLLKRIALWQSRSRMRDAWTDGTRFLFRGEDVVLRAEQAAKSLSLAFGDQVVQVEGTRPDYRAIIHAHLRDMAKKELPPRLQELAQLHGISVRCVTVRAQKSRWGSCSARGNISLNWRLIQTPPFIIDYLIIHELMHRREMNHSARYWKLVAEAFPGYREAEKWLKSGRIELRT